MIYLNIYYQGSLEMKEKKTTSSIKLKIEVERYKLLVVDWKESGIDLEQA